jgi:DNA-directed RNA polymerase specialized sigma24 family protein
MPRTTRDEEPPVEPPPAEALGELADQSLKPQHAGAPRRDPRDIGFSSLADRTEAELLGCMSLQRSDPTAARDAWNELYVRHSRYVFAVVARVFGDPFRDVDAVTDVVSDTFRAAYDWAGRHADVAGRFDAPDSETIRRKMLGWLSVTAGRLARDHVANRGRTPRTFLDGEMDSRPEERDDSEPPASRMRTLLQSALEKLSNDELEALRVSLPWYDPCTSAFAFPRGEAAKTASALGIAPDALRQRRFRSLRRLQSLLRDRSGV